MYGTIHTNGRMPEWSKGYDLRSYIARFVGSNPTPAITVMTP